MTNNLPSMPKKLINKVDSRGHYRAYKLCNPWSALKDKLGDQVVTKRK